MLTFLHLLVLALEFGGDISGLVLVKDSKRVIRQRCTSYSQEGRLWGRLSAWCPYNLIKKLVMKRYEMCLPVDERGCHVLRKYKMKTKQVKRMEEESKNLLCRCRCSRNLRAVLLQCFS